jgi:hypothetical protein
VKKLKRDTMGRKKGIQVIILEGKVIKNRKEGIKMFYEKIKTKF